MAKALARTTTVTWREQELGTALNRLQKIHRIAIWLDRRADPRQQIDVQLVAAPLATVIEKAARQCDLGTVFHNGMVFVGPPRAALELATLMALARDSFSDAGSATRRLWFKPKTFQWQRLSQPRDLLQKCAEQGDTRWHGLQAVPHDLLAERSQLDAAPIDLAVLLLQGFDLTCRLNPQSQTLEVVNIEQPVEWTRSYSLLRVDPARVKRVLAELPDDAAKVIDQRLVVTGLVERHELAKALLRGAATAKRQDRATRPQRKTPSKRQRSTYTLKIESQPLGAVVDQLGRQLGLTVAWESDEDVATLRQRRISCEVREATLDELLSAILEPAGLRAQRQGKRVVIK